MTKPGSHVLALDVGERRIGVAVAGTIAKLPRPLTTLERSPKLWQDIAALVSREDAKIIVVGLPRGMQGQDTEQTRRTREFADELGRQVGDVEVVLQDEALTSHHAEAELSRRGKSGDKAAIDALAATMILEDYLNQPSPR